MTDVFSNFIADLLNDAFEAFDSALLAMLHNMLRVEELLDTVVTSNIITDVYNFIYGTAVALVALKFLFKGFQIYILWRDGDADSSPQDMLMGAIQAVVVMVAFPFLYEIMADIAEWFTEGIMGRFGVADAESFLFNPVTATAGIFVLLLLVIYIVLALALAVVLLRRSFELLVLRLGIPMAAIGLIDSDGGVFKTYIQTLFRTLFTSIIQLVLFSLSVRFLGGGVMSVNNILFAIATVSASFSTPTLMQSILIPTGRGGGVVNKIYAGSMAFRAVKGLIGR